MRRAATIPLFLLAACSGEELGTEVRMIVPAGGYAPRYGEVPMPSDAFRGADGRLERIAGLEQVVKKETAAFSAHLSALDGFGLRPLVEMFVAAPIDPATLPAQTSLPGDPLALVDVDPESPELGRTIPMDWKFDPARLVVLGSPQLGVVLREGTRYAAVITRDVRGADGHRLKASAALFEVPQSGRWKSTAEALQTVAGFEAFRDRSRIAGVAVFTTQHATGVVHRARAMLEDHVPSLSFPDEALIFDSPAELQSLLGVAARDQLGRERLGWSNPTGIAGENVGLIATGRMTTVRFIREDGGDGPDSATFEIDESGSPRIVERAHEIPVTFVLPKAPPASADGYPIVLFGHGLGASRHAVLTFAEPLAAAGFAIAAIDMDGHGSRFNRGDSTNNTAGIVGARFSGTKELADGFGDVTGPITTLALLHGFMNLSATRDSMRQSVLDLCQLARLVAQPDLDLSALSGGTALKFDARRIAYLGESYGGVIGSVFAGVEPTVDLFVLDVPGAGIIDLEIAGSPGLYGPVLLFARNIYGLEGRFDRFHPSAALTQAIVDGADPLAYARHVFTGAQRSYVMIEVVGDEIMSNVGTRALAGALGLPVLAPNAMMSGNAPGGGTAVMVQYSPATHGANWTSEVGILNYVPGFPFEGDDPFPLLPKPIEIKNPIRETLEQVVEILQTHRTQPAPQVRSTLPPIADFDGDGMTDEEETSAGRDPWDPDA